MKYDLKEKCMFCPLNCTNWQFSCNGFVGSHILPIDLLIIENMIKLAQTDFTG